MPTVPELIALGWQRQQMGDLIGAEYAYRRAVTADRRHDDALVRLGVVSLRLGKLDEAIAHLQQAAQLAPGRADIHTNLGVAQASRGQLTEAVASFEEALRLNPQFLDARHNIGIALRDLGRLPEAARCLREVVALQPGYLAVRVSLGGVLFALRELDEAIIQFRQVVQLAPYDVEAHMNLGRALAEQGQLAEAVACFERVCQLRPDQGEAHSNLGMALGRQGKPRQALLSLHQAARLKPNSPEIQNAIGAALAELDHLEAALDALQQALRLRPSYPEALNNQGNILRRYGRLDDAAASLQAALDINPEYAEARHNLAITYLDQGKPDEALHNIDEALRQCPEVPEWRKNRGLVLLRRGQWEQGWPEFEWRWGCKGLPKRPFSQPQWDGGPLDGKTILLHAEQGLGDTLQFIRYTPLVKARGATVLVECPAILHRLLARCAGIDGLVVQGGDLPAFDVHLPLMSLPNRFGTTVANVPAPIPYVLADPERIAHWARELRSIGGHRIGLCWQGNPKHANDRHRSFALDRAAPLAGVPGVTLVRLQTGPGVVEQLAAVRDRLPVTDLDGPRGHTYRPLEDSAAIMKNLDLVVSCDTSLAHLAGALGVPTWLALPFAPDWRWLDHRPDTPWYPTMRLFRQQALGQWDDVFESMARELQRAVHRDHTYPEAASSRQ